MGLLGRVLQVCRARVRVVNGQVRSLHLHEYQSQEIMRGFGIRVPRGSAVSTKEEALAAAKSLGEGTDIVVKAQILAGGRGMGTFGNGFKSGVHICYEPEKAAEVASKMVGQKLITKQTGPEGKLCSKGGTSIEDIAAEDPTAIKRIPINIQVGVTDAEAEAVAKAMGFSGDGVQKCADQVRKLYNLFIEKDATLVEVNPMIETPEGDVVSIDAKINFDDNAEFRQPEIFAMRDTSQEDPREVRASEAGLNYIGLDGNIGCLVNGAGLAMATMDIIKLHGGNPANFLDVGGGATDQQVTEAFTILNDDPKVQAILVNIFGGIMRCDVIAQGIINAAETIKLRVPLVVRLQGNKVDEAKKLIFDSGLRMIAADDLDEAGKKVVKLAEIVHLATTVDVNVSFQLPY